MAALRPVLLAVACLIGNNAMAQRQAQWTESPGELGLGYPVPMSQDVSLPFDGFRSYPSLHARHQDLMLTSDWVHGTIVGQTSAERDIWAYRVGDADLLTVEGLAEPAMMTQGGIHAREWQSPEVLTGIMETLVDRADDQHLYRYLLDNANVVLLPVQNIDGFLQTQRFPELSYLDSDINDPVNSPRDGRMRRKNMLGVDELFSTPQDHLLGVDLNRNNPPYWNSSNRSSGDNRSLVHHGVAAHSEPETQAMVATSMLGPQDRLRMYTDVHSFSQVFFSSTTENMRRNIIQRNLLRDFQNHHAAFDQAKLYVDVPGPASVGIGATDEYFAETFQVPSWTLEIEPSNFASSPATDRHIGLPGCGADYGGLASNCHDGFVLPESQIRRVRDELAQTFAVAYYHQAGPPAVSQLRLIDQQTEAVVVDMEWDVVESNQRELHQNVIQALQPDRDYTLWLAYNKPMRWRNDADEVVPLPGQGNALPIVQLDQNLDDGALLQMPETPVSWLGQRDGVTDGYRRYRDDALSKTISISAADLSADGTINLSTSTSDMLGQRTDANPATAVDWGDGHWTGYESETGVEGDFGGIDSQLSYPVSSTTLADPFVIEAGVSAAWFDSTRSGEGFLLEAISDNRAILYWFTYDDAGQPRWLIGDGQIRGNRIAVSEFLEPATGSPFGASFDPDQIVLGSAGSADFLFNDCGAASAGFKQDGVRKLRHNLSRLTSLSGLGCGQQNSAQPGDSISGSWYDPSNSGQGIVVQRIAADRAIIYWFTYDDQGAPYWIFGDGLVTGDTLQIDQALTFSGPQFGQAFDTSALQQSIWGQLTLRFSCSTASVEYVSPQAGFGSGSMPLSRLTTINGLACDD